MDDAHSLVAPYALDALDREDERAFEEHLALCDRCRSELSALREAAAVLAKHAFARVRLDGPLVRLLPAASALVILAAGLAMTARAFPEVT